nr:L-type lectin-domain containing receptor kinase IX.1-like [Ipomoea trifida]
MTAAAMDISPFVFLVLPSLVCSLSFDLPSISPKDTNVHIYVEGDATITSQGIQLTPYERKLALTNKSGRATYVESLHLWDKASGDLANFTTHFTFTIDSDGNPNYADGLAFFLANFSAPINGTLTDGGGIGLMNETLAIALDPFVAVVFDTFSYQENRSRTNVSINVKSMVNPVNIKPWFNNVTQGMDNNASITYSASSKVLQVVFTGFWNGESMTESLSYQVDLREYLPEFVSVGFSASTGMLFEKNGIRSWQFNSTSLRDIKSSNVLLDSSFNAKLGDFGLAWLVDHENAPQKTIAGGTPGYVAPECIFTFKTSKESDVYSFGIVALEIATGQRAIIVNQPEGVKTLVEWVWDLYGMGKLFEVIDPKLCGNFDEQEMKQLMMVGLWCAHPDSTCRPKISQALHCLKFLVQLPTLPPKMPKPVYSTSFSRGHWQILEGHRSSSNNSCPSRFTSSSIMDAASSSSSASHSHTQ